MFICKKKECERKDSCSHAKKHLPHDGLEMGCLQGTSNRGKKSVIKTSCPGCTWIGKGKMPYDHEKIIRKQRTRTLWAPSDSPIGIIDLGSAVDERKKLNDILHEEGVLI